jgi:hypothetical protein
MGLVQVRIDTFTDVGTDQLYSLMDEAFESSSERFKWEVSAPELYAYDGGRKWVYIKNGSASAFVKGQVVTQEAISGGAVRGEVERAPVTSIPVVVVGVAQVAIPAGSFGWVVREGDCEVLAGTETIDVNEPISVSDATVGAAMECAGDAADLLRQFGYAREDAAAAATARCYVNCTG